MDRHQILSELEFKAVRSSGPGGQHVNKTSTKVELRFDPASSQGLSDSECLIVVNRLARRMDKDGLIRLTEDNSRSQLRNKQVVSDRLITLIEEALKPRKRRRPTRPTRASKEARLKGKKLHSEKKRSRRRPDID
jgi:ribosome-associated protein